MKCYKCGNIKNGRDCDNCGHISCDGCDRFRGPVCIGSCNYTSGALGQATAIVREAAEVAA